MPQHVTGCGRWGQDGALLSREVIGGSRDLAGEGEPSIDFRHGRVPGASDLAVGRARQSYGVRQPSRRQTWLYILFVPLGPHKNRGGDERYESEASEVDIGCGV